jgi:hypothetical protein
MPNEVEFSWQNYLAGYGQPADFEDILLDAEAGLFTGVKSDHIAQVLQSSSIREVPPGEYVYDESTPRTDVPLFLVLAGEFVVDQTIYDDEVRTVTFCGPGELLNDVGCVLGGVTRRFIQRGRDGFALANVYTNDGAVVLEIQNPVKSIWGIEASQLHFNFSRLLSIKLVNRGVASDKILVPQRRLVVRRIRKMILEAPSRPNPSIAPGTRRSLIYDVAVRKSDLARDLRMKGVSTVSEVCKWLHDKELPGHKIPSKSFLWKGSTIEISKPMLNVLLDHTSELY